MLLCMAPPVPTFVGEVQVTRPSQDTRPWFSKQNETRVQLRVKKVEAFKQLRTCRETTTQFVVWTGAEQTRSLGRTKRHGRSAFPAESEAADNMRPFFRTRGFDSFWLRFLFCRFRPPSATPEHRVDHSNSNPAGRSRGWQAGRPLPNAADRRCVLQSIRVSQQ